MMLLLVSHFYEITRFTPLRNYPFHTFTKSSQRASLIAMRWKGPPAEPSLVPLCSPFQGRRRRRRRRRRRPPPPLEAD